MRTINPLKLELLFILILLILCIYKLSSIGGNGRVESLKLASSKSLFSIEDFTNRGANFMSDTSHQLALTVTVESESNSQSEASISKAKRTSPNLPSNPKLKGVNDTIADFILMIAQYAKTEQEKYNIPPSIKIAQACLESDYGRSKLALEANNLFGIKHKSGETLTEAESKLINTHISHNTREVYGGVTKRINDNFNSYNSRWASIRHHSIFLEKRISGKFNKHYAALENTNSPKDWAELLQKASYSTDPKYSVKIMSIIRMYNLEMYDK